MRLHHKALLSLSLLASHSLTPSLIPLQGRQAQAYPPEKSVVPASRGGAAPREGVSRKKVGEHDYSHLDDADEAEYRVDKVQASINNILYGDQKKLVGDISEFTKQQLQASYNIKVEKIIKVIHHVYSCVAIIHQRHKGEFRRFHVFFNKQGGISRVTYPESIKGRSIAWEKVMRLIRATNDGSVAGQLACFAKRVSPYYTHGVLEPVDIESLLYDWKHRYSYYHMEVLHTHVEESQALLFDYDVHVKFRVTWKDIEGRYRHKQICYGRYSVNLRDMQAEIVAAQILRTTKAP